MTELPPADGKKTCKNILIRIKQDARVSGRGTASTSHLGAHCRQGYETLFFFACGMIECFQERRKREKEGSESRERSQVGPGAAGVPWELQWLCGRHCALLWGSVRIPGLSKMATEACLGPRRARRASVFEGH